MVQQRSASWPMAVIPVYGQAACFQDFAGQPLLSLEGRLATCREGAIHEVLTDTQLSPSRVAYVGDTLRVFFYESVQQERLRASCGEQSCDFSLGLPDRPLECSGFWVAGTALVTRLLTNERTTEFLSWRI
jgi:hypothetical protein